MTRLEILKQVRKEKRPHATIGFDTVEILEAMERYAEQKLNIAGVVRPESASASEGEQLGTDGVSLSLPRTTPCCRHKVSSHRTRFFPPLRCDNFYHNFDIEDFGECTECKGKDVRKSSEGHL